MSPTPKQHGLYTATTLLGNTLRERLNEMYDRVPEDSMEDRTKEAYQHALNGIELIEAFLLTEAPKWWERGMK